MHPAIFLPSYDCTSPTYDLITSKSIVSWGNSSGTSRWDCLTHDCLMFSLPAGDLDSILAPQWCRTRNSPTRNGTNHSTPKYSMAQVFEYFSFACETLQQVIQRSTISRTCREPVVENFLNGLIFLLQTELSGIPGWATMLLNELYYKIAHYLQYH